MESRYSELVNLAEYPTERLIGLFDGIPVRRHKEYKKECDGITHAQKDWNAEVHTLTRFHGGKGSRWSFMSLCIPECLPDRLEIVSYANEFAFLYDDESEYIAKNEVDKMNDDLLQGFLKTAPSRYTQYERESIAARAAGKKLLQARMLQEMIQIDYERALTTARAWAEFLEKSAGRRHNVCFQTLEEYIPYRILDCGEMFWFGMMTFGMGITIPQHEVEHCKKLQRPAYIVLGLQNDLFSWEKERRAATRHGLDYVVNAIWVLMSEHSTTVQEAKRLCQNIILEHVEQYKSVMEENIKNESLSKDLRRYIWAMQFSISGNAVWSSTCPRYSHDISSYDFEKPCLGTSRNTYPDPNSEIAMSNSKSDETNILDNAV